MRGHSSDLPGAPGTTRPLSSAQRRLWTNDQRRPQSPANNCWVAERLRGELDLRALRTALAELLRRHDALRTRFTSGAGRAEQVVEPSVELALDLVDLTEAPDRDQVLAAEIRRAAAVPFDLATGPLLRASVIRLDSRQHVLVLVVHHMVTDARSLRIINRDLESRYLAYRDGLTPPPAKPLPAPAATRPGSAGDPLSYWRSALAGLPTLELPTDHPHSPVASTECATITLRLSPEDLTRLDRIGRDRHATRYMAAFAIFLVLLARHTGQRDIGVSTMVSRRPAGSAQETVGLFVDAAVLRVDLSPTDTFTSLLHRVRETVLDALDHPMPFVDLVEDLLPHRQPGRVPLAPVAFVMDEPEVTGPVLAGLRVEQLGQEPGGPTFDLALVLACGAQPTVTVRYRRDLFDQDTVQRFAGHYRTLLRTVLTGPDHPLRQHSLVVGDAERDQLTPQDEQLTLPALVPVDDAVAAMAAADPAAIAVLAPDLTLTRAELLGAADGVAGRLARAGVRAGDRVGLTEEYGPGMVIGLLGALRAGAVVVALGGTGIAGRSRLRAVITGSEAVAFAGGPAVPATEVAPATRAGREHEIAVLHWIGDQYRAPRAAPISHRALAIACAELNRLAGSGAEDRTLVLSSPRFGTGLAQTLALLTVGGTLVLPEPGQADDPAHWADLAAAHRITVLIATSAQLESLAAAGNPLPHLRAVLVDDGLVRPEPDTWASVAPNATVCRLFGVPDAAFYSMAGTPGAATTPLAGHQIVVLDETMRPVPVGLPGLLHIGGAGLPEQDNRPDVLLRWRGRRLLRTEAPVRWRQAGELQVLPGGRGPRQVRAADVESVLRTHPGIAAATTAMRIDDEDGVRMLVGFVVPRQRGALDLAAVRRLLEDRLPTTMMPEQVEVVDAIPRAPDGTVDWLALPGAAR